MVGPDVSNDKPENEVTNNGSEVTTELEEKIIRQVEYYFGDFNLIKDKFLQEQIKLDDGWVSLVTLLTFNRLALLSKDTNEIIKALEKSTSGLLEIHEDKEKIRRSPNVPLPEMNEDRRKELMERTVYCKGFPRDSKLNDLLEFFYKYGDIENVAMRNWNDKATKEWKFKGSVFVIFKTVNGADEFLKIESVQYNNEELIRKWQKDYVEEKRKEKLEIRSRHGKKSKQGNKKDGQNESKNNDKDGGNGAEDGSGGGGDGDCEDGDAEDEHDDGFATGTVVELTGLDSTIKWDQIKERIEEMGLAVAFIEYVPGNEVAFVRLTKKDTATELAKLLEKEDNKLKLGDKELTVRVVEGEEEIKFLEKQKLAMMKRRNSNKMKSVSRKGGRGGRGKHRGKWGGGGKRRRGASPSGQPPAKINKGTSKAAE